MTSFIILGGGLIGAACALRLEREGFEVTLVDPGAEQRGASFGNAGHIAVEQAEPLASPATVRGAAAMLFGAGGPLDFRWRDLDVWAPWAAEFLRASTPQRFAAGTAALTALLTEAVPAWRALLEDVARPDLIREDGHAVLWLDESAADKGRASWRSAATGPASFNDMTSDEMAPYRRLMPAGPPVAGLRFHGTARIRSPGQARSAMLAAFERRGGRVIRQQAARVAAAASIEVEVGDRILRADRLLIAAGAWSGPLMAQLDIRAPLIAERGYSIQTTCERWPGDLPTAVIEDLSLVLAPHTEGLRCTSHVEFGRPDAPPDPRKWAQLERNVRSLGLPVSANARRWMGPRPTLPDYLPAIGRLERRPNVFYAFGHQHLGLTLAAVTAERIGALAAGDSPDLTPFRIERFA